MNRIDQKFKELRRKRKKAFIAFITAGDPSLKITEELVLGLERAGVDIIELGVPFSDPLADGPTIQAASQRALKAGVTLNKIFNLVKRLRLKTEIPIALMTYYNPVYKNGEKTVINLAKKCGVDGFIIPDLPPEEAGSFIKYARAKNISTVFFLAPTTTTARIKKIVKAASGFIYFVSLTGVTGARTQLPSVLAKQIRMAKKYTDKPICVGFGISQPSQVKKIAGMSDGVIVGSAIIHEIEKSKRNIVKNVTKLVVKLRKGL